MNAKQLYYRARRHFLERNTHVLADVQLQWGRNERWFAREFAIAMNRELCGSTNAACLGRSQRYVDCEYGYGDISLWKAGHAGLPIQLWEVKTFYSTRSSTQHLQRVVKRAAQQLHDSHLQPERNIGLFILIYLARDNPRRNHNNNIAAFINRCRGAIRTQFDSDHHIRINPLLGLRHFDYGADGKWWTASWTTWGILQP